MGNWKTTEARYEVHEISKRKHETYTMIKTGKEISEWCKMKNEAYGYVEGVGGDKTYTCWAVLAE